jgi:hypothetical protein
MRKLAGLIRTAIQLCLKTLRLVIGYARHFVLVYWFGARVVGAEQKAANVEQLYLKIAALRSTSTPTAEADAPAYQPPNAFRRAISVLRNAYGRLDLDQDRM